MNYLIIESLEQYHHFYGDDFKVECPVGSGQMLTLAECARELALRLSRIFKQEPGGQRPYHGRVGNYAKDPEWKDLHLFYEYFDGDTGEGLGASHQTGWTALVTEMVEDVAKARAESGEEEKVRLRRPSVSERRQMNT